MTFIHLGVALHAFSVWLLVECYDIRHKFLLLSSKKQPDLYYFEAITDVSSQVKFCMENTTRLVTSFLWLQNSID